MTPNLNQISTKYGLIILLIVLVGLAGWWAGKDLTQLTAFILGVGTAFHAIFISDK